MPRPFGGDHEDVHILGRLDLIEMDIEPMTEDQGLVRIQMGKNVILENTRLMLVRGEDLNQISLFGRF